MISVFVECCFCTCYHFDGKKDFFSSIGFITLAFTLKDRNCTKRLSRRPPCGSIKSESICTIRAQLYSICDTRINRMTDFETLLNLTYKLFRFPAVLDLAYLERFIAVRNE